MQLQVTVAMHCDRQRHASNILTFLSEPTVIVCTMSLDGYHTYTSLIVLLSLTMHRHRPSNCTKILPVLEGCGPLGVAIFTAVVGVVRVAVLTTVVGVIEVTVLTVLLPSSLHCIPVTQTNAGLMLGPLTAHTFTL